VGVVTVNVGILTVTANDNTQYKMNLNKLSASVVGTTS
jgi:hypothetical protein